MDFVFEQLIADLFGIPSNAWYNALLLLSYSREYGAKKGQLMNVGRKSEQERYENGEWRKEREAKGVNKVKNV